MRRLFLFAIGGTGSRVLKSLTMLLAAGVKQGNGRPFEIVPIIIDPHKSNDDLKRTTRLLDCYQSIVDVTGVDNGFFSTSISTLNRLVATENRLAGTFTFNLQQVANSRFKDYIQFSQLNEANKALCDVLFSGKSIDKRGNPVDLLDIEMDIGFVGNPNLGSVVLNQVKDSEEFREFGSNINPDDRIFIISSIFGGTGAAGFPAVLKNIRAARSNNKIDGKGFLQDAKIGALTVLPYFNIEKDESSPIQKSDFISKSKSALAYYRDNVNSSVNVLYYVADDLAGKAYKNDPGDGGQRNDAHFVEFASALAIIDFLGIEDNELVTREGRPLKPIFKEFGIRNDADTVTFADLSNHTEQQVALRLSQMVLWLKYIRNQLNKSIEIEPWSIDKPELDKTFLGSTFYRTHVMDFLSSFEIWLKELQGNRRAFAPFNLDSAVDSFIVGSPATSGLFAPKVDYKAIDDSLSRQSKGKSFPSVEKKFIKLFFQATEKILTSKFGLKA